jgi:hypothetical protein
MILQYLEENLGALQIKLSPEEIKEVRDIAAKADAANGPRYPPAYQDMVYGDTPEL